MLAEGELRQAQRFTTGANAAGYTLASVALNLRQEDGEGSVPLVAIHHDSSGEPGTLLGVLGNPADPFGDTRLAAGNRTFTAASALSLDANANYWLVLKDTKSTAGEEHYSASYAFSAAQTGAEGFGIADGRRSWTEADGWYTDSNNVRMEIRGTVGGTGTNNAPVFDDAGVTLEVAENSAADSDVGAVIPAATDADSGDTLTYSMEGTDAGSFTFDASARQIKTRTGVTYNYEATKNTYSVTVKATDGTASDTIAVTIDLTDVAEQSAKPAKPTLAQVSGSSTTLTAAWTKPELNGGPDITDYHVRFRQGTGTWRDFSHGGEVVTTTLTGLTAGTEYQVQVQAVNGETDSDWSDASDAVRTNAETPATCTLNAGDLWCGVLTVGAVNSSEDGFFGTTGGLSDTTLSVGTRSYTIDALVVYNPSSTSSAGNLSFSLTGALTTAHKAKLVLHVGSDSFAFDDAQYFAGNDSYLWTGTGLDWSSASTVTLRLRAPNNAPAFASATATREVEENSAAGTNVGGAVTATDADSGDTLEYSLEGTDAASFDIDDSSGQIETVSSATYDYEAAQNTYSVTVKATDGLASDTIAVTINLADAAEKSAKPAKPTLAAVSDSSTSLAAAWTKPGLNGGPDITGYDLQYREGTSGGWENFTLTGTGVTALITGLTASTEYQVQVRAKNGETDSDWSDPSDAVSTNAGATAPTIDDVDITSTPVLETDTYGAGEKIRLTVEFSEAVTVTGEPHIEFSLGNSSDTRRVEAVYESGSGSDELVFAYTVVSTDEDDNGIFTHPDALMLETGESIVSAGGVAADVDHAGSGTESGHKVDGSRSIVSVAVLSRPELETDTYGAGETILFTVVFNVAVDVTGEPVFSFSIGDSKGNSRQVDAAYRSGSGTTALVFGYTVVSTDEDDDGIFLLDGTNLDNPDGPVRPDSDDSLTFTGTTTDAPLAWPSGRGTQSGHKVDGSRTTGNNAPEFASGTAGLSLPENSAAGTVMTDSALALTATDADTGDTLAYSMEGPDAASFDFDASTREMKARSGVTYDFEATQKTYSVTVKVDDGNGGTDTIAVTIDVTDVNEKSAKPAKPTLSAVSGSPTSLDASWTEPGLNGGPAITGYELQYREGTAGTWEDFTHGDASTAATITGLTADTEYQVQVRAKNGEADSDWSDPSDGVRTNAEETPEPDAPTITAVAVTSTPLLTSSGGSTPDTYGAGETIEVSVTFSEAVTATDDTDFVLNVSDDKRAPLVRGSGTATLVFGYTVVSSDEDDDGIRIGDQDRTLVGDRGGNAQNGTITSLATGTAADLTHEALRPLSDHKVDGSRTPTPDGEPSNNPPVFTEGDSATRAVAKGSDPRTKVGDPVLATDADNDELVYDLEGADESLFIIAANSAQIRTWPVPGVVDYSGRDSYQVTVKARDGERGSDTIAVTIDFTDSGDDPPQKQPPTVSVTASATAVSPGRAVTLMADARDPDGGLVTYEWSTEPAGRGSFDPAETNHASVTWTPSTPGNVEILVTVTDDEGETASAMVTVTVTTALTVEVTAVPTTVVPDGEVMLTADAYDPDDGYLTYMWSSEGSEGTGGEFVGRTDEKTARWTAPSVRGASFEIRVTVMTDSGGDTASDTVTVTVGASPPPPPPPPPSTEPPTVSVTPSAKTVSAGGEVMLTATARDPDGGSVTYAWSSPSGSFDATDGASATWTAPPEPGAVEIRVTVTDDEGDTASAAVTVTVTGAPSVTSVKSAAPSVSPGGEVMLTVDAHDPDGGELTYAWSASSGSFDATDGATVTWTAPPEPGEVEIRVTATDDEGETASATVTVTVAGTPTVTATAEPAMVAPGGAVVLTAAGTDPDGGELTYAWSASSGSFDATDKATVTWTAPPEPGEVEIRVTATDDEGETASATVTVTVTVAGTPTVTATAEPAMVAPGGAVVLTAAGSDPDGGELTYAWISPSGSFDATDGARVTWTAPPEPGAVEIRVTATDDEGETASATVTVTVTVAGTPTVTATAEPAMVAPGGAVVLTAAGTDPDGGELTYAWSASSGSFDATDGATVTWTAPPEPGAVEIRVTATDDEGETASATVTVTVTVAGTPTVTATAEPAMVAPGGAVVLTAAGSDPDGGELTYAWISSSGSFDATDGAVVTWTAPPEPGAVEIRVTATDDEGETASATVTVTVTVAGTPTVTATAEPAMVAPGGAVVLTAAGSDPDGGELTYAWISSSGSFDATDGATVTWTAPPEPGAVEIRVTATDDEGETASATVTVTVLEPVPALPGLAALLLGGLLLIGGARSRRRRTA